MVVDAVRQKRFEQVWTHNMSCVSKADVKATKLKKSSVSIEWVPDLDKLGAAPDLLRIVQGMSCTVLNHHDGGRVHGLASTVPKSVKVSWNQESVPIKSVVDWTKSFVVEDEPVMSCRLGSSLDQDPHLVVVVVRASGYDAGVMWMMQKVFATETSWIREFGCVR